MTTAGWVIMIASVVGVTLWCVYCVVRVLRLPQRAADDVTSRVEIDAEARTDEA